MKRRSFWFTWFAVIAVVSLSLLFDGNLQVNEADKLPMALKQVSPEWLPNDWYFDSSQSHQWLFQAIAGWPLRWFGFPIGSLIDRLLGYGLWSLGFTAVALLIGLTPATSALALALFLPHQGLLAGEWMIGGAESKTWAYGLLLLSFAFWFPGRRFGLASLFAGLACSFHPLVGLYGAAALFVLDANRRTSKPRAYLFSTLRLFPPFLLGSFALWQPLWQQLSWGNLYREAVQSGAPKVSWIYVYLRLPHHLLPKAWGKADWLGALVHLGILFISLMVWRLALRRNQRLIAMAGIDSSVINAFGLWTFVGVGFFVSGLFLAPFDLQGRWLRFYPFRFADSLLPLLLALLIAALLQLWLAQLEFGQVLVVSLMFLLVITQAPAIQSGALWCSCDFWAVSGERRALDQAILQFTPPSSVLLTPPAGFEDLAWRLQRSSVVQFKLFPSQSQAIDQWYRRLSAVIGMPAEHSEKLGFEAVGTFLNGYRGLSSHQLQSLALKYDVAAVITASQQAGPSGWRRQFQDQHWTLWQR